MQSHASSSRSKKPCDEVGFLPPVVPLPFPAFARHEHAPVHVWPFPRSPSALQTAVLLCSVKPTTARRLLQKKYQLSPDPDNKGCYLYRYGLQSISMQAPSLPPLYHSAVLHCISHCWARTAPLHLLQPSYWRPHLLVTPFPCPQQNVPAPPCLPPVP